MVSMSQVITARVSDELVGQIDLLAKANDRSRAWTVTKLLETITAREIEFFDSIERARADVEAGRFVTHDEMMARLRERWGQRKAA
jgi:predicted transcriptional regulator